MGDEEKLSHVVATWFYLRHFLWTWQPPIATQTMGTLRWKKRKKEKTRVPQRKLGARYSDASALFRNRRLTTQVTSVQKYKI